MNKLNKLTLFFFAICGLYACKKQAEAGNPGAPGADAHLQTAVFNLSQTDWASDTVAKRWEASIFWDQITNRVVEEGTLSVYIDQNGAWHPLPYTFGDDYINYSYSNRFIQVFNGDSHGGIPLQSPGNLKLKCVVIDGN